MCDAVSGGLCTGDVTFQASIKIKQSAHVVFYLLCAMKSAVNLNYQFTPSHPSERELCILTRLPQDNHHIFHISSEVVLGGLFLIPVAF